MTKLYHIDLHSNSTADSVEELYYFYVWDEQDNFEAINAYFLTKDSIAHPAHVDSNFKMDDFLIETEDDEITPVARSIPEKEVLKYMRTYALINELPISQGE